MRTFFVRVFDDVLLLTFTYKIQGEPVGRMSYGPAESLCYTRDRL
jgi:hypothetical protein